MTTGNKGEWSEPYVLMRLAAEPKLYLGDSDFNQIKEIYYPITEIIRHEKLNNINITFNEDFVIVQNGMIQNIVEKDKFKYFADLCLMRIVSVKSSNGAFSLPEIEEFLKSISLVGLKTKSMLKNDISLTVIESRTYLQPTLGFSIKSQLGQPSTLVNASKSTNFTYRIINFFPDNEEINRVNTIKTFSKRIKEINKSGGKLIFESVDNQNFDSNLRTVDSQFPIVLAEMILSYYSSDDSDSGLIQNLISEITANNPLRLNLSINPKLYTFMLVKFLTDYALGMRASEVWNRDYQATGGYLVVNAKGDILCYHFYFRKEFEAYLLNNTKFETASSSRNNFGKVYVENGNIKMKLNLQIRFIQ